MSSATKTLRDGTQVCLRRAVPEDAKAILAYLETVAAESDNLTFGPGELGFTEEDEADYIRGKAPGQLVLLATVGGEIAAMGGIDRVLRPRVRHCGTVGISVRESFWGRGLARTMMEFLLVWCRHAGVLQLNLEVRADNQAAIGLYTSLGFCAEGRRPRAFRVGETYYDVLLMTCALD